MESCQIEQCVELERLISEKRIQENKQINPETTFNKNL